jgi:hypothetical protein
VSEESVVSEAPWQAETPFEDAPAFEAPAPPPPTQPDGLVTPFLSEYFAGEVSVPVAPEREDLLELLHELHDEEFDELLFELADEAAAAYSDSRPGEHAEPGAAPERAEAFMHAYLAPLQQEAEQTLDAMAEAAADRPAMTDHELDELFARFAPANESLSPVFEDFLGGVFDKVKKVASAGLKLAKDFALGPFLFQIKRLLPAVLKRVLRFGLDKLPKTYRPLASRLARRLLGPVAGEHAAEEDSEHAQPATADVAEMQLEFDLATASLLFASDPVEGEVAVAELVGEAEAAESDAIASLHQARARFVDEIISLEDGEDPTPVVQRFLPAALPILRPIIATIGKDRLVRIASPLVAKLIARFVGKEGSKALAQAIVKAGLSLVGLEAPPEREREAAGAALAATVEDTVRELGELDEVVFEDDDLFEAAVYEAFERAAGANLPQELLKPEARETATIDGAWSLTPEGPVKCYKKHTHALEVTVTPQMARQIVTWGGTPLADALRVRTGGDEPVRAVAHLYEAIPGTRLAVIARHERIPGDAATAIHPLTPETAGMLFREPGLGRSVGEEFEEDPAYIAAGQRFVRLELPGAPPGPPRASAARKVARPTQVNVTLNFRPARRQITVYLFLAEREAQEIVTRIKGGATPGAVAALLLAPARAAFERMLRGQDRAHLRPVYEDELSPRRVRRGFRRSLRVVARGAGGFLRGLRLASWTHRALVGHAGLAREFAAAAASERDGVTVVVRLQQIPGLDALGRALRGGSPSRGQRRDVRLGEPQRAVVEVVAGFRR